jgi:signal transduction histidine kinase/DNA-binding response OmpR family regulator/HAMP domain-containing protein
MKKIQNKLLILLIAVALLPTLATEFLTFKTTKSEQEKNTFIDLNTTLNHRIRLIENSFSQEMRQIETIATTPSVISEFITLNAKIESTVDISSSLDTFLRNYKDSREQLHNIYFISKTGDIKYTAHETNDNSTHINDDLGTNIFTGAFNQELMATLVQEVFRTKEAAYSKFGKYRGDYNIYSTFLAQPVFDKKSLVGVVVFNAQLDILSHFTTNDLIQGQTGEAMLGRLDEENVQYLTASRFSEKKSNALSLKLNSGMGLAMQQAVQGKSGQGESIDYRLHDVFAVWQYLEAYDFAIVVKIDKQEVISQLTGFQLATYMIVFLVSVPLIIFAFVVSRRFTRPIIDMVHSTNAIANGDIEQELKISSEDEIGQLANSINEMSSHINQAFKNEEADRWLQEGVVKLSETMRGNQISTDLADNIVSFVCGYLNAKVGSLYIVKDQELELAGGFAFVPHFGNQSIEFGEGLVGQAAISKMVMNIHQVPDDYVSISSSMGEITPQTLVIYPLIKDDIVIGVMELGWLEQEHKQAYDYLDAISESMATALSVAESHHKLQLLLDQSQQQMEELQVREEELRAINEEVEQRSTQLANSQKKLEQQSQELQSTNDALEYKNSAIEAKNAEIEISRQEISEKAEELEASSRYKSEFLANMSHELRTPLNSMLILSRILSDNDEGNLDEDQVESSKVIHRSGQELLSLINDILDLSKIEAGKMEVLYESYNIRDITYELNGQFKAITSEKDLTFSVVIDDDVPYAMSIEVQKVQQVLKNLLSNAIKFTESGGVTLAAKIAPAGREYNLASLSKQPVLAISIIDSGIGISEEKQKAIFEAFQQADGSTSRRYGGTGLGLTISRHLTELIEGELDVESVPNKGSTFTLYIPIKDPIDHVDGAEPAMMIAPVLSQMFTSSHPVDESVTPTPEQQSLANLKARMSSITDDNKIIVIIEDDVNFSKVLSSLATKSGFNCVLATTGSQGIAMVKEHNPCGVILDLGLPDLPGADILEILKEHPDTRDIPVHVISGHNKIKELTEKGAAAFHQKPIATQEIRTLLYSLVQSSPSQKTQHLIVFDRGDSKSEIDLSFLAETQMNITYVGSLDELSHHLGNCGDVISGIIVKSQQLKDDQLSWLNDNYQFNNERKISVIVFVDQDPQPEQITLLEQLDCHVIIDGAHSHERLHDEVSLFLSAVDNKTAIKRVTQEVPQLTKATSSPALKKAAEEVRNHETTFAGCNVLLVDDDLRNTFALSKVLKKQGMKVTLADNGQMALDRLAANSSIDIVLMDIMMPVMDGHEAMRQIRLQEQYVNLPIIALTAKAMQEDRRKCVEAGASDYLTKPVDIDKLIAMMRVWLYQEVA